MTKQVCQTDNSFPLTKQDALKKAKKARDEAWKAYNEVCKFIAYCEAWNVYEANKAYCEAWNAYDEAEKAYCEAEKA